MFQIVLTVLQENGMQTNFSKTINIPNIFEYKEDAFRHIKENLFPKDKSDYGLNSNTFSFYLVGNTIVYRIIKFETCDFDKSIVKNFQQTKLIYRIQSV